MMTPDVIKVEVKPDFVLEAEFETGEIRRFNMRSYLEYPAHSPLKELGAFMRAGFLRMGTNADLKKFPGLYP